MWEKSVITNTITTIIIDSRQSMGVERFISLFIFFKFKYCVNVNAYLMTVVENVSKNLVKLPFYLFYIYFF